MKRESSRLYRSRQKLLIASAPLEGQATRLAVRRRELIAFVLGSLVTLVSAVLPIGIQVLAERHSKTLERKIEAVSRLAELRISTENQGEDELHALDKKIEEIVARWVKDGLIDPRPLADLKKSRAELDSKREGDDAKFASTIALMEILFGIDENVYHRSVMTKDLAAANAAFEASSKKLGAIIKRLADIHRMGKGLPEKELTELADEFIDSLYDYSLCAWEVHYEINFGRRHGIDALIKAIRSNRTG